MAGQPEKKEKVLKTYCRKTVIDRDFISSGYESWAKAPAGKKNLWRVAEEYGSADALIDEITSEIETRSLSFRPFKRYARKEKGKNGKNRKISIACVKYQVVTYAFRNATADMMHAKLGYYQSAGIRGRGQKHVRKALRKWSAEGNAYHVKSDVRKCYEHITCSLVMRMLTKFVANEDVLYMARSLLSCFTFGVLEIGTYFALLMANLVLSFAYHFIEGLHKVRRGERKRLVRHQIWHLDDLLLIGNDKRDLKRAMRKLARYMCCFLGLELKSWKVAATGDVERLDMGGFVARGGVVTLRSHLFLSSKRAFARFDKKRTSTLASRCCSYWGWLKHSDSREFCKANNVFGLLKSARKLKSRASKRKAAACIAQ